jgi:hypothetical protein
MTQVVYTKTEVDGLVKGLQDQITTLAKVDPMFFWFKSDNAATTGYYVYNPITGKKRLLTAAEWSVIVATDSTAKPTVIKDADLKAIPNA